MATQASRHKPVIPVGFDDLTLVFGLLAASCALASIALVPVMGIFALAFGLVGIICGMAARQHGRYYREELDHPSRLWLGTGFAAISIILGLLSVAAALTGALHGLH